MVFALNTKTETMKEAAASAESENYSQEKRAGTA